MATSRTSDEREFRLRALSPADVDWIHTACQDPEIQRWTLVPRPYTRAHAESFVAEGAGERQVWAVERIADGAGVGVIGVHSVVDGMADIGYWIAPWGRRQGAGSDAVRILCEELVEWEDVQSVSARIARTNLASQSTVRRVGFTEDPAAAVCTCPDGDQHVPGVTFLYWID